MIENSLSEDVPIMRSLEKVLRHLFGAAVVVLVLCLLCAAPAGAEKSISVDVPAVPVSINEPVTVPVTIHDADNILGFLIEVPNTIPGTVITIAENAPVAALPGASALVNSGESADVQKYIWFTSAAQGISGDMTLFSLEITATVDSPSSIPLTVSAVEIDNAEFQDVYAEYKVISGTLAVTGAQGQNQPVQSGGSLPDVSMDTANNGTTVESIPGMNSDVLPTESNTTEPSDDVPPEIGYDVPTPEAPGSAFPLFGLFAAVGLIFLMSGVRRG